MSAEEPVDVRIQRTRRQLRDAVLSLAEEQDLATMTVAQITERAGINRQTFYRHYRDREEIVAQMLDTLFDELAAEHDTLFRAHRAPSPDVPPPSLVALFRALGQHPALYRRLLGEAGSTAFAERLRRLHERWFLRLWDDLGIAVPVTEPPATLRARVAATATEGALGWWLRAGETISPERAASWTWELLSPLWFEHSSLKRDAAHH